MPAAPQTSILTRHDGHARPLRRVAAPLRVCAAPRGCQDAGAVYGAARAIVVGTLLGIALWVAMVGIALALVFLIRW
jgi:hypothetical protein